MRKILTGVLAFTVCCLFTSTIVIEKMQTQKAEKSSQKISLEKTKSSLFYIVKEHGGNLAIFESANKEVPIKVFEDVFISNLPSKDQEDVKKGIEVKTQEELDRLIDDLTS